MPRRTKKIYGKKAPNQKRRFYTKRYGGSYDENIKGLMHDVAGTLSEDIAQKTTEMFKNQLNAEFGEKVAEKAADKVIISISQAFQDAASKISVKTPTEAPLLGENLGQVEEQPDISETSMNEPPPVDEIPSEIPSAETETPSEFDTSAEPETPPVEPETPSVEPETPSVEPETPPVEPETPSVEPETPSVEPETTSAEPETPSVEPETPPAGMESGPSPPEMEQPAQTGEGNANPETNEIQPPKIGGKSRAKRGNKRMSRNRRNIARQYSNQYY
jgi:hypothetical protein